MLWDNSEIISILLNIQCFYKKNIFLTLDELGNMHNFVNTSAPFRLFVPFCLTFDCWFKQRNFSFRLDLD